MEQVIVPVILGIVIIVLGVTNMMGNISTLHWYHRQRVTPENIKPFGKLVGIGMIIVGAGIVLSGAFFFVAQRTGNDVFAIVGAALTLVAVIVGLPIVFYAMFKYNKGIF